MALFTDYEAAPRIDTELENTQTVYGVPVAMPTTPPSVQRTNTVITTYSYKILFLTKAEAEDGAAAIQAVLDAEGQLLDPPASVGTAKARFAYKNGGYDIEVNYCKTETSLQTITE